MFKTNELDINYFVELAKNHVGEIHDLEYQSFRAEQFYNGKTIRVPVSAYVQSDDKITKALFINNVNLDTGKTLKAYKFGILDFRKYK